MSHQIRAVLFAAILGGSVACQPEGSSDATASLRHTSTPDTPAVSTSRRLEGRFFMGGPIDEGQLIPGNSHFYVWLEGAAARALYEQLSATPQPAVCDDGSAWVKGAQTVLCTVNADADEYSCHFAVDVRAGSLDPGMSC
jgi:hypothetical protein